MKIDGIYIFKSNPNLCCPLFCKHSSVSSVDFTKSMFAEEAEWNDGPEAKALTEAVIHGTPMPENINATVNS